MILNTGCRTDIPAYYSEWFYNRIEAGFVLVRNPYHPELVTKYRLTPEVVDILCFCSKNPKPMLSGLSKIAAYRQFWFVTITPYGKEIEPNVPESAQVIETVRQLSGIVGQKAVAWRYDPIFLSEKYTAEYHVEQFEKMAAALQGKIAFCVISFIDLYEKTRRNFPQVRAVTKEEQEFLVKKFAEIGRRYRMPVRTCCENPELGKYGVETSGCMTQEVLQRGTGCLLSVPAKKKAPRAECNCLLGADIGAYNTCPHGCIYCYANYDRQTVLQNFHNHDPNSPFLIGTGHPEDQIREAVQESWIDGQLRLF